MFGACARASIDDSIDASETGEGGFAMSWVLRQQNSRKLVWSRFASSGSPDAEEALPGRLSDHESMRSTAVIGALVAAKSW
jgi:hypothetical protein